MSSNHNEKYLKTKIGIISIAFLFLLFSTYLPVPKNTPDSIWVTFSIFILGILLWFTNIIPPAVTGMAIIFLLSIFNILSFEQATIGLGEEIIWLIIAVLIMGVAVEKTGLEKKLSYKILSLSKGSVKLTILSLIVVAFILTFIMPNAVGRLTVLVTISSGIIQLMKEQGGENISKSIMLTVTNAPYITNICLMTGASGSIYAVGLFESVLGYQWSYLHWMIIMTPISMVVLLSLWGFIIWLFPSDVKVIKGGQSYFENELKKLGTLSQPEKKLILLYIFLILLWITTKLHGIPIAMSAVFVCILLFIPGMKIVNWKEAVKGVNWDVPFIFAAGFALAHAFEESGIVTWLSSVALKYLSNLSIFTLAISIMVLLILIRLSFTNFNSMVASLMPVVLTFSLGTPYNPVWIGMISLIASSTAFLIPTQSIGAMMTYSLGHYNTNDMLKIGSLLTIMMLILTLVMSLYIWPLIGLNIYK
jgi:solute carrier family 13 (sodium-dependent dicarboxylate transporter), member 2/3/5